MNDGLGLRERKKLRTRQAISEAALVLFLEHGFDEVSIAEIAAAADVSRMTVFNYFPAKEDLILAQIDDHVEHAARSIRAREPGESPLVALRREFLTELAASSPITGLCADEQFLAVQRMIMFTSSLKLRMIEQMLRAEDRLAEELATANGGDPAEIVFRLAAAQVNAVRSTLVSHNLDRVLVDESVKAIYPDAVQDASRAFDQLEDGLGGL